MRHNGETEKMLVMSDVQIYICYPTEETKSYEEVNVSVFTKYSWERFYLLFFFKKKKKKNLKKKKKKKFEKKKKKKILKKKKKKKPQAHCKRIKLILKNGLQIQHPTRLWLYNKVCIRQQFLKYSLSYSTIRN